MEKQAVLDTIDKLLIVQERDAQIAQCRRELDSLPARQKETEALIAGARQAVEQAKENFKLRQAAIKQWELEIETGRGQIVKLREQQYQIKSNVEYRALNNEIAHLQQQIGGLEEHAIEAMEQAEQAQAEMRQQQDRMDKEAGHIQERLRSLGQRRGELEQDLQRIETERSVLASAIDRHWLERYDYTMDHKKDKALVPIENNACGQCHMTLPPQVIHDTRRSEEIVTCSFCGRILYWTR